MKFISPCNIIYYGCFNFRINYFRYLLFAKILTICYKYVTYKLNEPGFLVILICQE